MTKSKHLVERDDQLRALKEAAFDSSSSGGVVMLSGEAGFGKTVLLNQFLSSLDHRYRVLTAACEPVGVPAPFAPLFDLLDDLPEELRTDVRTGSSRQAVMAGVLDVLKNDRIVLVIEDVHWADEATLGLIRYLGRRIEATSSILIFSFRLEEIDLTHPLRLVIADLGREATRIELPALSISGVKEMARGMNVDAEKVHAATLGNPFFVEEVLRNPDEKLSPTISNAILATAAQLPVPALNLLYLVALSPEGVELDLLTDYDSEAGTHLDWAIQRRLLASERGRITCRHDLIRETLVQSIPPALKASLHRKLLTFLERRATNPQTTARLAYHSIGADQGDKALRYSLEAARDAVKASAHRHAAFHFSNALEFRDRMDAGLLQKTLLEAAFEHYLINLFDEAIELSRQRMALAENPIEEARRRAWVSFFEIRKNNVDKARSEAAKAIDTLLLEPPSDELALAYSVLALVDRMAITDQSAIENADRAVEIARATGAVWIEVQAATSAGAARLQLGDRSGLQLVEDAVQLGTEAGAVDAVARAMYVMGYFHYVTARLDESLYWFNRGLDYTSAGELDAWYVAILTTMAVIDVATGRWTNADQKLEQVLGQRTCISTEVEALVAAGTLRVRRGDPGSRELIDRLMARVGEDNGLSERMMASELVMEAAWIGIVPEATAREHYLSIVESGALSSDGWARGRFAFWAHRLGFEPPPGRIPGPARLEREGQIAEAADLWEERNFPVEAAITRATIPEADLDMVFGGLSRLGAEGVSQGLRRELGRRGVRGIPRGERATTKRHPAGLTSRQGEVLNLMVGGLSNAAIAHELYISEKTTGHHVSAILQKLGASNRSQAVAMALARGWSDLGS